MVDKYTLVHILDEAQIIYVPNRSKKTKNAFSIKVLFQNNTSKQTLISALVHNGILFDELPLRYIRGGVLLGIPMTNEKNTNEDVIDTSDVLVDSPSHIGTYIKESNNVTPNETENSVTV